MVNDILPSEIPFFSSNSIVATNYSFNAAAKTVTVNETGIKRFLYIVNSTRNEVIYNPYRSNLGGTYSSGVITLTFDTSVYMNNNDSLLVLYEGATSKLVTLQATNNVGTPQDLSTTAEGHLEVAIHAPRLPFGSIHTESITPVFQIDSVYGINAAEMLSTTGRAIAGATSATITGNNNLFTVSTGTTSYSFATIQSRRRLRYRAGQGIVGRFTALWPARADSAYLIAGFGTSESGFYFGYAHLSSAGLTSQEFGIFHVTGGVRSIRTLTVSAHTATAGNVSIVLNSATAVDIAVLSGDSITTVANKIAAGTYPGWTAEARGSTVIFLANDAAVKSGTYTATGAGVTASFATTLEGVASTDTFIPKSTWNGDKLDGTGASGATLDPTKGNVFQINIQYLGFGSVVFLVEVGAEGNNAEFVEVHTIRFPNSRTTTSVSQPSFPFTMTAYSAGSTTDLSVKAGSCAGFIEGNIRLIGPRSSFSNVSTTVTTGAYYTLFSIRNDLIHAHGITERANQSVVNILSFGGAHDDATPITFYLLRNATLVGTPNWTRWSTNSCIYYDTAATTATISNNSQIIEVIPIGQSGSLLVPLEDTTTLQPGETITVAATTTTGTSTFTIATLNTREDQ